VKLSTKLGVKKGANQKSWGEWPTQAPLVTATDGNITEPKIQKDELKIPLNTYSVHSVKCNFVKTAVLTAQLPIS